VVQDNDYRVWRAYDNHYWPADFLIDQQGKVVASHFGEGGYDTMEDDIPQAARRRAAGRGG
jgi:hypothetical protein